MLAQIETTVEPAVIRHPIYNYAAAKRIHQDGFRVALCGEGADELFAGYEPAEQAFMRSNALGGSDDAGPTDCRHFGIYTFNSRMVTRGDTSGERELT
jgi:asparagine synthetase B (glutamine-hydrolysing)